MEFSTGSAPRARYQAQSDALSAALGNPDNTIYVNELAELVTVLLPHINLAVWNRLANDLMLPAAEWLAKEPFEMEHIIEVKHVASVLHNSLATPPEFNASLAHLIADIQKLADVFSKHAATNTVRLIVEALHRVPCPKFHQDNLTLRLVCTYTGVGTEWLENSNVNPHPDCCGGTIVLDETRIQNLKAFEVGLMKGKRWPGNPMGIFHRSPAVDISQPRLVVKMDVAH